MTLIATVLFGLLASAVVLVLAAGAVAAIFTHRIAGKVRRGFSPRGQFVETAAGRVHVVEQGEGSPVVLIHGLAGQIGNYSYGVIGSLSERYRVIAIDRLGSGFSDPIPADFTGVRRHAAVVAEVLEGLGAAPALIVGHSLGGAVTLALAVDHPERVKALCLIAPLTAMEEEPPGPFRGLKVASPWLRRLVAHTVAIPMSMTRREATLEALFGPEDAPADFPTRGLGLLSLRPEAFIGAAADMVHANDDLPWLMARYGQISAPIDVLVADQDRILDPNRHGAALAGIVPHATLRRMQGGHMIPVTAPDAVAAFIDEAAQRAFAT